ncbi:MAG: helix-turn-helix domain-containing protein [Muribaculaceae bacterium]|nr:helix-turn-helix domain-containing protein [Muribaculaceae bacterium]
MFRHVSFLYLDDDSDRFGVGSRIFSSTKCGVFLCTEGAARLSTGETSVELTPGSLFIYTVASIVEIIDMTNVKGVMIDVPTHELLNAIGSILDAPAMLHIRRHPLVTPEPDIFTDLMRRIRTLHKHGIELDASDADNYIHRIDRRIFCAESENLIFLLLKIYFTKHPVEASTRMRGDKIYQEFMQALYSRCHQFRSVNHYARMFNLSSKHFSKLIKTSSGMTPATIIDHAVVSEARRMLSEGTMSVKEVAVELNFPSQSFFGKYFKRHTGLTPSAYRKMS